MGIVSGHSETVSTSRATQFVIWRASFCVVSEETPAGSAELSGRWTDAKGLLGDAKIVIYLN